MDTVTARLERYRGWARMHWKKAQEQGDERLRRFHAERAATWQELAAMIDHRKVRDRTQRHSGSMAQSVPPGRMPYSPISESASTRLRFLPTGQPLHRDDPARAL
jgi:hypothetical protein